MPLASALVPLASASVPFQVFQFKLSFTSKRYLLPRKRKTLPLQEQSIVSDGLHLSLKMDSTNCLVFRFVF